MSMMVILIAMQSTRMQDQESSSEVSLSEATTKLRKST